MNTNTRNPFIVNGKIPAKLFCDREKETALMISKVTNGNNVLLVSSRRMGKTGLIEHCFEQPELNDRYVFFADILQTTCLREFAYVLGRQIFETLKPVSRRMMELFMQTVRSINAEYGYDVLTGLPKFNFSLGAIRNPQYTLDEIFDYIEKSDRRCLIAIDEFQQVAHYPEKNTEALLRTHIQRCSNADFIFAGSERHILTEMFNTYARPFYQSTSTVSLDAIPLEKYVQFVKKHFENAGKTIETETIARVYHLFGGNTYCMQKTFNTAFNNVLAGDECSIDLFTQSIGDILKENERTYQLRLSQISVNAKELLFAVAKDGVAQRILSGQFIRQHQLPSASAVQSALKILLSEDWITYTVDEKGQKSYLLSDYFMTLWIRDNFGSGWQL